MPNLINKMISRELSQAFDEAEGLIMVSLAGLTVAETEALRNSLAEQGVRLRMVRNRLARIAMKERGLEPPEDLLVGNMAMAWGSPEDAIHAAKVFSEPAVKKAGKVSLRGGLLDGKFLAAEDAQALAKLPSRDELRAMLLGVISGPARSIASLANAPQGALARVLQAHIDAQGEAAPEEVAEEGAE